MATFGLTPKERELLEQAGEDGWVVNVLMRDGQRQEEGFLRERACQQLAERGLLRFLGWVGAPNRDAIWTSRWRLTDAARRRLAEAEPQSGEPDWIRTIRKAGD